MGVKNFTYSDYTLQILVSMGINYPVLKEIYPVLNKPLFFVVPTGNIAAAVDFLADKDTPKLNPNLSFKQLNEVLDSINSDFAVYPFVQTKKGIKFLELIIDAVIAGSQDSSNFNALPIVVSENIPYGYDLSNFFTVFFNRDFKNISFDRMCVVPPEPKSDLPVILNQFCCSTKYATHDEKAFMAAACFLYPFYRDNGLEKNFMFLLDWAKKLVELSEDSCDADNLSNLFLIELYKWQKDTAFSSVYDLSRPVINAQRIMSNFMFFDDKYVYFQERFFKKIFSSFLKLFNVNTLKKSLVENGILCSENTNTYTVKMIYYDSSGELCRERMLRFSREKLNKTGEVNFVEMCLDTQVSDATMSVPLK